MHPEAGNGYDPYDNGKDDDSVGFGVYYPATIDLESVKT
jgi:hypothetical protein